MKGRRTAGSSYTCCMQQASDIRPNRRAPLPLPTPLLCPPPSSPLVLLAGSVLLKTVMPATADTFKGSYAAGWLHDYEQRAPPQLPFICMRVAEVHWQPLLPPPAAACHQLDMRCHLFDLLLPPAAAACCRRLLPPLAAAVACCRCRLLLLPPAAAAAALLPVACVYPCLSAEDLCALACAAGPRLCTGQGSGQRWLHCLPDRRQEEQASGAPPDAGGQRVHAAPARGSGLLPPRSLSLSHTLPAPMMSSGSRAGSAASSCAAAWALAWPCAAAAALNRLSCTPQPPSNFVLSTPFPALNK